ncbi:hypothetical protein CRYUN_Cryun26dG0128900 [Craigia yunnanensis]
MAPGKESKLKVSKRKHFKSLEIRKDENNGIKDLKRLQAVREALVKQQAKLKEKLNLAEHNSKPILMDKLRLVNRRLARFNAWTQIYIETKLADPAWDAANKAN